VSSARGASHPTAIWAKPRRTAAQDGQESCTAIAASVHPTKKPADLVLLVDSGQEVQVAKVTVPAVNRT